MDQSKSKAGMCAAIAASSVGVSNHIFWGIYLLAKQGEWGKFCLASICFLCAWIWLAKVCSDVPSEPKPEIASSLPFFASAMLPFTIPSAVTLLSLVTAVEPIKLQTAILMIFGLALIAVFSLIAKVVVCLKTPEPTNSHE